MTFFAGDELDAADLNAAVNVIGCRVTQSSAQTGWTDNTFTTVTFTAEDFDWGPSGGSLHDNSTNPSRIGIGQKLGLWEVQATIAFAQNSAVQRHAVHLLLNGSAINGSMNSLGLSTGQFVVISTPLTYVQATASGDYVETQGLVDTTSAGTLGTAVSGELRSSFQARWLGNQN
jgi:hypothetical protein